MTFSEAIARLVARQALTQAEARDCLRQIMRGEASPIQMAGFLTALRMKGESVDEIAGAAEAMREAALSVRCDAPVIVDTCGTGGDGQGSFNVSTAAAFVVSGAGFTVAKHGNRSISSQCGSADVLEHMGLRIEVTPEEASTLLREVGIAFLFAPRFHPAMRHAMPVRKELAMRTIFNVLGPLSNPARPNVQLVGVYDPALVQPMAEVMVRLGLRQGMVVHGQGHDEIVLSGPTQAVEIVDGNRIERRFTPEDFGVRPHSTDQVKGGSAAQNAQIVLDILKGHSGPFRDVVLVNAAAALQAAHRQTGKSITLQQAVQQAAESIDQKKALQKWEALKTALGAPR